MTPEPWLLTGPIGESGDAFSGSSGPYPLTRISTTAGEMWLVSDSDAWLIAFSGAASCCAAVPGVERGARRVVGAVRQRREIHVQRHRILRRIQIRLHAERADLLAGGLEFAGHRIARQ